MMSTVSATYQGFSLSTFAKGKRKITSKNSVRNTIEFHCNAYPYGCRPARAPAHGEAVTCAEIATDNDDDDDDDDDDGRDR